MQSHSLSNSSGVSSGCLSSASVSPAREGSFPTHYRIVGFPVDPRVQAKTAELLAQVPLLNSQHLEAHRRMMEEWVKLEQNQWNRLVRLNRNHGERDDDHSHDTHSLFHSKYEDSSSDSAADC